MCGQRDKADKFLAADMHLNVQPFPGHSVGTHFGWFVIRTVTLITSGPGLWYAVTAFGPYPRGDFGKIGASVTMVEPPRNLVLLPFDPRTDKAATEALA